MKALLTLLTVASLAGGCKPAPITGATPPAPAKPAEAWPYSRIPSELGPFKLTERSVVRGAPSDSIFRFRDTTRTTLSVIVYDVSSDVKVDADSQKWTVREGEKFARVEEIQKQRGVLADYRVAESDSTRFTVDRLSILEHEIAVPARFANGQIAVEFQYLYLIAGRFLKVRATVPVDVWQTSEVPRFARALATLVASP